MTLSRGSVYPSPPCWRTDGSFLPDTRTNPRSPVAAGGDGGAWDLLPVRLANAAGTLNGLASERSTMAPAAPLPPSPPEPRDAASSRARIP
jgi:hypothetical protein